MQLRDNHWFRSSRILTTFAMRMHCVPFDKGPSIGYSVLNGPHDPNSLPNQKPPSLKRSNLRIKEHLTLPSSKYIMLPRPTNSRRPSLLNCHMVDLDDPSFSDLSPRSARWSLPPGMKSAEAWPGGGYLSGLCPFDFSLWHLDRIIKHNTCHLQTPAPPEPQHYPTLSMAS